MARRARDNAEQLFRRYDSYSVQEHQRQRLRATIDSADPETIRAADISELAKQFAEQFRLDSPVLIEGAISVSVEEAQVDVTGDFRFGAFGPGPTFVAGIYVAYYVPFSGERELFNCSASTINVSMRPVELGKDELIFTYQRPDQDVAATKVEF
jgi:hypothetical protein